MSVNKVHDRSSNDKLLAGKYVKMEIDDPYAPGEKILVDRQIRHDQLAWFHTHKRIDEAQYQAGLAYQRDWEAAEQGARAIDPTIEAVDGGLGIDPLPDRQIAARNKLVKLERVLGRRVVWIVQAVLIHGTTLESLAPDRTRSAVETIGRMFRMGLEELAVEYGFSHKRYHAKRKMAQPEMTEP